MPTLKIYTIRDAKAECYLAPFTFRTDGEAIRAFGDSVADGKTPLAQHPEDYYLIRIGEFDVEKGVITPCAPVSLASALDFKKGE